VRAGAAASAPPPAPLDHVTVILVEPAEPGNVGAVARVMWNLGGGSLRLVVADPHRAARLVGGEARARACHGRPLLEAASFHADLRAALKGVGRCYAFSARTGRFRRPRLTLEQAAARVAGDRGGRCALLFGREDRGLLAEEVRQAHELVTIPAPGADPVLNLSHAVAIALWETQRAAGALRLPARRTPAPRGATAEDRAALRDDASRLLVELGLRAGAHSDLHGRILRRLVDLFDRAGGEHSDFSMLQGLFVSFRRALAAARRGSRS